MENWLGGDRGHVVRQTAERMNLGDLLCLSFRCPFSVNTRGLNEHRMQGRQLTHVIAWWAVVLSLNDGIAFISIGAFVAVLWQAFSVKLLVRAHRDPQVSGQGQFFGSVLIFECWQRW